MWSPIQGRTNQEYLRLPSSRAPSGWEARRLLRLPLFPPPMDAPLVSVPAADPDHQKRRKKYHLPLPPPELHEPRWSPSPLMQCSIIALKPREGASMRPGARIPRHGTRRRCQEGAPAEQCRAWSYMASRPSVPQAAARAAAAKVVAKAVSGLAASCAHCSVAATRPSL